MSRDTIRVLGARAHNLKDVSLGIPQHRITAFVGVSGSGKSSIVFDTIAVEASASSTPRFRGSSATSCRSTRGRRSMRSRT